MRQTKDSIDRYFEYSLHLEARTIWLGSINVTDDQESGVDAIMAERFIKALHILQTGSKAEEPITVYMNNPGGHWAHGMAIFDAIRACRAPVKIECFGQVYSMGSVILQAADERILHPNVSFMIHDGHASFDGNARDFEAWARDAKNIRNEMYRIFAERSQKPVGYWSKKCVVDYVMSADEAVREGLADQVLRPQKAFAKKNGRAR